VFPGLPKKHGIGILGAGFCGMLWLSATIAAAAAPASEDIQGRLQRTWRAAIASAPLPGNGCFTADYPGTAWKRVACTKASSLPFLPAQDPGSFIVGNGNDHAAETATPISSAVGSFPSVKGLKRERNGRDSNTYSLQLNSSYFVSPVCQGAQNPSDCRAFMQFVYSANHDSRGGAFMEVWLLNYGSACPSGWHGFTPDCYLNSSRVRIPIQELSALSDLQVSGSAVSAGNDTVTVTTSTKAYAATMPDSTIDLAGNWNTAEYNVFGHGNGSEAVFNTGTKIEVNIQLQDGSTSAPSCITDGFTLESNNLGLNRCRAAGGKTPSITFSESN
jgi:hypothetical protein